jgi:hypothetical protein
VPGTDCAISSRLDERVNLCYDCNATKETDASWIFRLFLRVEDEDGSSLDLLATSDKVRRWTVSLFVRPC